MQVSIKTTVIEQTAKGYAEYYARQICKAYRLRLVVGMPVLIIGITFWFYQFIPNAGLSLPRYIFNCCLIIIMDSVIGMIACFVYRTNVSEMMSQMKIFYNRLGISGNLSIQVYDEDLQITSKSRILKFSFFHGQLFLHPPYRIRKICQCADAIYFLAGNCYFVIPVWNCDPEEWKQICSFLKQTFGNRYICLKKPVFPNRVKENSR